MQVQGHGLEMAYYSRRTFLVIPLNRLDLGQPEKTINRVKDNAIG
jgi:hypothetical protein